MNVGKLAVSRPVAVTMRIAALVLLGFICFLRLPIDLLPKIDIPTINVNVNWPNTGPEEMESQITRPLEQAVSSIRGLDRVISTSSQGNSNVRIQFKYGVDVDKAAIDVMQQVQRAVGRFPKDPNISTPQIFKFDPSTTPILVYGVSSKRDNLVKLRDRIINELSPQIEAAGGVAQVNISGGQLRAVIVDVDPSKLQARGLSISQVSRRIQEENISQPAGISIEGRTQYNLRSIGYFRTLEDIRNVPVGTINGSQITLKEVASVRDANQDITSYTRLNGEPALNVTITKQSDANTVETSKRVQEVIKGIEERNPDIDFNMAYNQATFIEKSIADLNETAIIGGALAILIITFFLRNLRSTFVVALSIPISIISTFSLMYFCGFTLNTISLSGLALATGLIVDDAIVVLENIYRHIERDKKSPMEAAISGTQEILSAVLASTFTVMIVFIPLFLIQGQAGQVFSQFALVVMFSIAISLLDATTVVPMLASRMIREQDVHDEANPELRIQRGEKPTLATKTFDRFGKYFHSLDTSYRSGLSWAISHRLAIVSLGLVSILVAFLLWPLVGRENLPQSDSGNLTLRIKLPIGTPLEVTNESVKKIESIVLKDEEVDNIISGAGANVGLRVRDAAPQEGSASIQLKLKRKSTTAEVQKRLQKALSVIPGTTVQVQPLDVVQNILGNNQGFAIDVYGQDMTKLTAASKQIQQAMSGIAGLQNVDLNVQDALPEIQWEVNREKATALGVSFTDVSSVIAAATTGQLSTYFQESGVQTPIYVQVPRELRYSISDLGKLPIINSSGKVINLNQVASPKYGVGPNQISRQDRQRVINVSGNVQNRAQSDVEEDVLKALKDTKLPEGTYWQLGVQQQQGKKDYSGLGLAVGLAIALIYMLLAAQFESFIDPLVVLVSVPLCAIGMVLLLFLTDRAFGLTAFIGLLMLIGIVVKNGILLVDYTNQLRESGMERTEAILTAGPTRLRPILMTTLAAILGMAPLALGLGSGSELYVPLATAVIGGLATSTVLTLFIVPTVYTLFDDLKSKFKSN